MKKRPNRNSKPDYVDNYPSCMKTAEKEESKVGQKHEDQMLVIAENLFDDKSDHKMSKSESKNDPDEVSCDPSSNLKSAKKY